MCALISENRLPLQRDSCSLSPCRLHCTERMDKSPIIDNWVNRRPFSKAVNLRRILPQTLPDSLCIVGGNSICQGSRHPHMHWRMPTGERSWPNCTERIKNDNSCTPLICDKAPSDRAARVRHLPGFNGSIHRWQNGWLETASSQLSCPVSSWEDPGEPDDLCHPVNGQVVL